MRDEVKTSCLKRLKRIEGQIRGLATMVEEDRYCIDVVTQIAAARDEDQIIAAGGEPLRIGDTDPRRRAGDNCETLVITH